MRARMNEESRWTRGHLVRLGSLLAVVVVGLPGGCKSRVEEDNSVGGSAGVGDSGASRGSGASGGSGGGSTTDLPLGERFCPSNPQFQVCSGPATIDVASTGHQTLQKATATAGMAGGAGFGGTGSSEEGVIVVAFEACFDIGAWQAFVAPEQDVLLGFSSSACSAPSMDRATASSSGWLSLHNGHPPGGQGGESSLFAHVAIPADEFECFYLSHFDEQSLCP